MKTTLFYKLFIIAFFAVNTLNAQNPWSSDTLTLYYPMGIQSIGEKVFVYDITPSTGPDRFKLWIKEDASSGWISNYMPHLTTAFYFLDEQKGWALQDSAYRAPRIWHTADGGQNWTPGFQFPKDYNVPFTRNNMQLLEGEIGYFGTQGYLFKTTDGGENFDLIYDSQDIFDVIGFANTNIGWVGYSYGLVILERTVDGGINWSEQNPDTISTSISTIHAYNENTIFIGKEYSIAISTDRGLNWATKPVPTESPYRFVSKIQYTPPVIWIIYANKIMYSSDNGENWSISSQTKSSKKAVDDDIEIIDFSMKDNEKGWALTNQGLIVYDVTTGVEKDEQLHDKFIVSPNPFNENTTISFRVLKRSSVSLRVYNMLGQELTTLMHEVLNPGEYSKVFSPVRLPEGVYLIKLSTDDKSHTKKMLFMK